MKAVYVETSIVSYLTGRISANLVAAAHQQLTREWWDCHRSRFELFVSPVVLDEAAKGDPEAARRRNGVLEGITSLAAEPEILDLADRFMADGALPEKAGDELMGLDYE